MLELHMPFIENNAKCSQKTGKVELNLINELIAEYLYTFDK